MKVHIDELFPNHISVEFWYVDPETRDGHMVSIYSIKVGQQDTTLRFNIKRIHNDTEDFNTIEIISMLGLPNPFYIIDEDPEIFTNDKKELVVYSLKTKTLKAKAIDYLLLRHEMPSIYEMINNNEDVYNKLKQLRDKYQL